MSGDDEIIVRGGKGDGVYVAEYQGKTVRLTGFILFLQRRVAAWVYKYFGE